MKPMKRLNYKQYEDKLISSKFILDFDVGVVHIVEEAKRAFIAYIYKGHEVVQVLGSPVLKDLKIRIRKELNKLGVVFKNEIRQGKKLPS